MSDGLPARRAALELIEAVLQNDRTLDEAIGASQAWQGLPPRDRAFARLSAVTVLRRLGQLDDFIHRRLSHPPKGRARQVIDILRLGLAQLLFLETPAHAAVNTTVCLARAKGLRGVSGLVNAVMRRASDEGRDIVSVQDEAHLNTPDWLWDDWTAQFGEATTRTIAKAHLVEPPLDLSATANPAEWAIRLGGTVLGTGTVRLAQHGNITDLEGFEDGVWWVQDAAVSLHPSGCWATSPASA